MKALLLRLHRWVTLVFAIPLAVIILTGLVLSVEPMLMDRAFTGYSVPLAKVEQALARFDPDRKATTLSVRAFENALIISEGRGSPPRRIDLTTLEAIPPARGLWTDTLTTARRLHETLLLDLKWLVDAATIAMTISMVFGLFMGWPHFRNTLGGWHRATAWILSPLLLLSPLTGLAIAFGITFTPPPARVDGPPVPLHEAVRIVALKHDLATVYWIRPQGGAMRARIYDGRQAKLFAVTRAGLVEGPQNWPRAWHEGVFAGFWSGLMNLVVSIALTGLLITGLTIWARRTLRRRRSAAVAGAVQRA
jgi:uncharacterized iron-regulated membrane protein